MIQEKEYYVNNDGNYANFSMKESWNNFKSSFKKEDEGGLFADTNFGKKVDQTFYSKKDKEVAAELERQKNNVGSSTFPADYNFDNGYTIIGTGTGDSFASDNGANTSCSFGKKAEGGIFSGFKTTTGTESIPDLAAYLKNAINGVDSTGKKKKYGIGWVILGGAVAIGLTVLAAKKIKQMRSANTNVSIVN